MARSAHVFFLVGLFVMVCGERSWASPSDLFGTGARSIALAGTGVAASESSAAAHLNPALLGGGRQQFRFGFSAARFTLRGKAEAMSFAHDDATGTAQFGLRLPFQLAGALQDRLGLGLDVITPSSGIARVRILETEAPRFPLAADRAESLNFNLGAGAVLPWGFRLGLGVMALASLGGSIDIEAGSSGAVSSRVDDELMLTTAPIVGLAWQGEGIEAGAVFRGALVSEFDLDVTLRDLGQIVLPPLDVSGLAQYDPTQVQLEAAVSRAGFRWVLGLSYKLWSRLERFKGPTVKCPSDVRCGQAPPADLGLSNTWVPRLAVERRLFSLARGEGSLRLGYFFEPTPLPSQTAETNLWDNSRHVITAGYAVSLTQELVELTAALSLQRHLLVPRRHEKGADIEVASALRNVESRGGVWFVNAELEAPF